MIYESIPQYSKEEIENILDRGQPNQMAVAILSAALYSENNDWAENICNNYSNHSNYTVRGNSILGLGHIARIHGKLSIESKKIIETAQNDKSKYVRGQATAAADDIEVFLR